MDITIIDRNTHVQIPTASHNGKVYVLANPDQEFNIKINVSTLNPQQKVNPYYQATLYINEEFVMTYTSSCTGEYTFIGYPKNSMLTEFTAFQFASTQFAAESGGAVAVSSSSSQPISTPHPSIRVVLSYGTAIPNKHALISKQFDYKSQKLLEKPKDVKFFNNPSMALVEGSHIIKCQSRSTVVFKKNNKIPDVCYTIYPETLETLRLRKIIIPPQVIATYFQAIAPAVVSSASSTESSAGGSSRSSTKRSSEDAASHVRDDNPVQSKKVKVKKEPIDLT